MSVTFIGIHTSSTTPGGDHITNPVRCRGNNCTSAALHGVEVTKWVGGMGLAPPSPVCFLLKREEGKKLFWDV